MRLPSLNALRAFEAAARHQSFARAAGELCVTEGAVSRHVKLLEQEMGVPLFRRLTRKVELTEQGLQLLSVVGHAFSDIAAGTARIATAKRDLKIICALTLSIRWLVPRLERFRAKHQDIQTRLTTKFYDWKEFLDGQYDLAFCCDNRDVPPGIKTVYFLPSALTPACAPRLLAGGATLRTPRDLSKFTLLHSTEDRRDWKLWVKAFDIADVDVMRGQIYTNLDMAAQAAVLGEGVVLGDLTFMKDEIENGRLVLPFEDMVVRDETEAYHVACRVESWSDPRVTAFYAWLFEERDRT